MTNIVGIMFEFKESCGTKDVGAHVTNIFYYYPFEREPQIGLKVVSKVNFHSKEFMCIIELPF